MNLMPYLTGQNSGAPHDAIFLRRFDAGAYAVRSGDYKLVIPGRSRAPELYNLRQEIGETTNIVATHAEKLQQLDAKRKTWDAQLMEPLFEGLHQGKSAKALAREIWRASPLLGAHVSRVVAGAGGGLFAGLAECYRRHRDE